MAKTMKRKFILIASGALLLVIALLIGLVSLGNYGRTMLQINDIMGYIVRSCGGDSPSPDDGKSMFDFGDYRERIESPYELRYFRVMLDRDDNVTGYDFTHIAAVTERSAAGFVSAALAEKDRNGYYYTDDDFYAFRRVETGTERYIVFLDVTTYLNAANSVTTTGIAIGAFSFLIFFIIVSVSAKYAIKPIVDNMEKQKQFITNAGHELKTPLAIISANTEVMEMMGGRNEWTESTIHQTKRMSSLINDLITLARMEERGDIVLHNVDFSKEALDAAESFKPVATQNKVRLEHDIKENVIVKGDEKLLHELVTILTDNAVKYCDKGGAVRIRLTARGSGIRSKEKGAKLTVSNEYADGAGIDYKRFFERFYRADQSHNSKKQGYGIGLSMANEIVQTCKGRIAVDWKDGVITFTVML
ncbi:MAG: HAMP domain-containing histidine kinase [Clostridia bacterium]|nr:HAMP domain-containing histidine kinase [Clostridia bacterium]